MDTNSVAYLQTVQDIAPSSDVASLVQYDTNTTRYRCRKCNSIFYRVKDWALHNFTYHLQPKYMCTHCDFRYLYDIKDFVCHMLSAHAINYFCCYICGSLYCNQDVFLLHMRDYHVSYFPDCYGGRYFYTCRKCTQRRRMINIEELLYHHRTRHVKLIRFCYICGKIVHRDIQHHLTRHFIRKLRKCPLGNCNETCLTLIDLREH
ncbi:zinc finger protein 33B-like, partial [Pseudomyrmex gracilis]|uniref:zinc finger protein 33B-like n=1 Tax=Pseudomyrmex gracilis TaxID=219809 RepID=UPI00099510AB